MKALPTSFSLLALLTCAGLTHAQTPSAQSIKAICKKVADWQIATYEDMGKYRNLPKEEDRKPWHHRNRYSDMIWHAGALFNGMLEWDTIAKNDHYINWLEAIGTKNQWGLFDQKPFHADSHTVGYVWLKLYQHSGNTKALDSVKGYFDKLLASPDRDKYHWHWCDTLFMSPPVWALLADVTGERRYLNYMDQQYRLCYDDLWNREDQLFFRDANKKSWGEKNGAKQYWARGNGWVYGGLSFMLPLLPEDWEARAFYVNLFKEMSTSLARSQRSDGTWSMGILGDEADYPVKEISGSNFFVFGLARGVNMGILNRATYQPIIFNGCNALVECVREDGMVTYVQGVGGYPVPADETLYANGTELYGVGGFLAAGSEVYKLLNGKNEPSTHF